VFVPFTEVPKNAGEDKEEAYVPILAVSVAPVTVPPDTIIADDMDPEIVTEEPTGDSVEPELVPPEILTEGPDEPKEDIEKAVYVLPEAVIADPAVETEDPTDG
jgi:hypothetical protein